MLGENSLRPPSAFIIIIAIFFTWTLPPSAFIIIIAMFFTWTFRFVSPKMFNKQVLPEKIHSDLPFHSSPSSQCSLHGYSDLQNDESTRVGCLQQSFKDSMSTPYANITLHS